MRFAASLTTSAFLVLGLIACSSEEVGSDGPKSRDGRTSTLSAELCEASPAPAVFGNALCLCGDFKDIGNLVVKSGTGSNLGSIGVNGSSKVINNTQVEGSFGSKKGFDAIGNVNVKKSLYTSGNLKVTGNLETGENLEIGGDLSGIGRLAVKGELRAGGTGGVLGYQDIKGRGAYQTPTHDPCACEGGSGYLDVAGEVAKAKSKNDNSAVGIGGDQSGIGFTDLNLKTGRYYLGSLTNIGYTKITVTGQVSLYIDGSIDQVGAEVFDLADDATLDLYVSGVIRQVGHMKLGNAKKPSAFRLFMGGGEEVSLNIGNQVFYGAVYAPRATIKYIGNTILEGGLFANTLAGIGNLEVHGARPTPPAGCPGSEDSTGSSSSGGASSSSGGTSTSSSSGGASSSSGGTSTSSGGSSGTPATSTTPPTRSDGVGTPQIK